MRQCLFCDRIANTKEHAWPRWLIDRFASECPRHVVADVRGSPIRRWLAKKPTLEVRHVCNRCNNGWMSALESQAKPLLESMLDGFRVGLDMAEQATVALWTLKTVMVLESFEPKEKMKFTQAERLQLRCFSVIPYRTVVWLARSLDPWQISSSKTEHADAVGKKSASAHSTTLAFGLLAIQVLTLRLSADISTTTSVTTDVRMGPWEEATTRIWPANRDAAVWPPRIGLQGEAGVVALAERFRTSKLQASEVQALAV